MSDITMCTLHSEKPYYITEINKNIYSIEELNYYLYNYLYLVDEEFFSESLIDYIENELKQKNCPVTAWEYAKEGGILTAVWNLSGIYNVGVDIDLRMIPMKQAVVEVCEIFEVNPYRLFSENCVILACDRGGQMVRSLSAQGIPAAVIGSTEKGIARVIRHGEETAGYLERPRADELSRIDGNTI